MVIKVKFCEYYTKINRLKHKWVILQKLPQLSDTQFSQVLNKLDHGFIKSHLALHFI